MTDSSVTQTVESVTESFNSSSERVTGSLWSGSIDGNYSDVESICFDIEFSQNDNSETTDEYRYDVTRNGGWFSILIMFMSKMIPLNVFILQMIQS